MTKLDKFMLFFITLIIGVGLGYAWRMLHEGDNRYRAYQAGQEYVLSVIQQESLKGWDFEMVVNETRVNFMPIRAKYPTVKIKE